jgi:hypothetical protein
MGSRLRPAKSILTRLFKKGYKLFQNPELAWVACVSETNVFPKILELHHSSIFNPLFL